MKTKVAIIGTQGIPAHYGGFETLAENLVCERQQPIEYTVFCSSKDLQTHMPELAGAKLKYLPLKSNGKQSIAYDILSMILSVRGYDALLILGVSGCIFIPVLKLLTRAKIVINIDGLEHRRQKWGRFAKWFLWHSEQMAVEHADVVVADNQGISDYVDSMYGRKPALIAYGGNHVVSEVVSDDEQRKVLDDYGLKSRFYALAVCRIEPENNLEMTLEAFAKTGRQFVLIGNFRDETFSNMLKNKYGALPNIHLFGACYDAKVLYALHKHARCYVHGHSAGGTNPSLVEAMFFEDCPILAYDVVYNRATTFGKAAYFANVDQLVDLLSKPLDDQKEICDLARKHYSWQTIVRQYEDLLLNT